MSTLAILHRDGNMVRFKVTHDDGNWSTTTRDCSAEIAEAKAKKVSLASILAKSVKLPDVQPVEAVVRIARPTQQEAGEETVTAQVEYVLPEHGHTDLTDLIHASIASLVEQIRNVRDIITQNAQALATVAERSWATEGHQHTALEEALVFAQETTSRLSLAVGRLHEELLALKAAEPVNVPHVHPAITGLTEQWQGFQEDLQALARDANKEHEHAYLTEVPPHPHAENAQALAEMRRELREEAKANSELVKQAKVELEEAFKEHVTKAGQKTHWIEVSRQQVDGKLLLVLEEGKNK